MDTKYSAFAGTKRVAAGALSEVIPELKRRFDADGGHDVLVFEDESGRQVDFDLTGSLSDALARVAAPPARGPGRPKLGVVSREVSLLPRHWDWLEQQPNGISAAIRRLVDQARKTEPGKERARLVRAALSRFMTAMAGNRADYEEATRALFAGDQKKLESLVQKWPKDIREYVIVRSREATRAAEE